MHARGKEKRQARRKGIDVQPGGDAGTHIFQPVSKRVGKLQIIRSTSLLHMIAGHGDEIEFRHMGRAITKNIRNDPHRRGGGIDVGVAHHEFLQHVILDRAC